MTTSEDQPKDWKERRHKDGCEATDSLSRAIF